MKTEDLFGITLQTLSPQEVKDKMGNNQIVLIDVHTLFEYGFEHIWGALLFGPAAELCRSFNRVLCAKGE
ncbi:MAG: hypothetical protein QM492_10975 [Rhodobacterales bacterium]